MLQTASVHAESQRAGGRRGTAGRGGEEGFGGGGGLQRGLMWGEAERGRHHGQTLLRNKLLGFA